MKYYFDDKENQKRLKIVMDEWLGTPFRHRTCVKGLGADCIHFVGGVFNEMKIFDFDLLGSIPDYPPDWHLHNTQQLLFEEIMKRIKVDVVQLNNLKNGDVVLSHFGKAASHTSIYFDDHLYHAINGIGVIKEQVDNSVVTGKLKFAVRILNR